ncbi:MAG: hypothetical protein ACFCUJ_10250 [Thiotrichales bacterium]
MTFPRFLLTCLVLLGALLAGCSHQPATPEEVTRDFWNAVIENNAERMQQLVAKDSLKDPRLLSNHDRKLRAVEIGTAEKTEISAQVATTLVGGEPGKETRLPISTQLVRENQQWRVHGQRSVDALVTASVQLMASQVSDNLANIGQDLSRSVTTGIESFMQSLNQELPQLKQQLEALSDEQKSQQLGSQLGVLFAQGIKEALREFNQGMEELGQELKRNAPAAPAPGAAERNESARPDERI